MDRNSRVDLLRKRIKSGINLVEMGKLSRVNTANSGLDNFYDARPSTPLEEKECLKNAPHYVGTYADNIQRETAFVKELDDWIYMGIVIDRLLLLIFGIGLVVGCVAILGKYLDQEWLN